MRFSDTRTRAYASGIGILALLVVLSCGCSNYGEKIIVDGTEVYYDGKKVDKATAERLGQFLKDTGFTDGNTKSVQLAKPGDKWQFRMVVKESYVNDEEYHATAGIYASQMSQELFNGEPVEFHLCDDRLNTEKVVQASN